MNIEVKYRPLSEMHPHPLNPRRAKENGIQELAKSISDNPDYFEVRPIVLSDRTGELVIIDGERRWDAAKFLGMSEAPSIVMHGLTAEKEEELINRANTHAGEWDLEKLKNWTAEQLTEWMVDELPTWETPKQETQEDGYNPDEAPEENRVKTGDIYQLGEHRLLCGDSAKPEDLEKLLNGQTVDLYITDPPYNVDYGSRNKALASIKDGTSHTLSCKDANIKNDKISKSDFRDLLQNVFKGVESFLKEGCPFYVFTPQGHNVLEFIQALDAANLEFRQTLIWVKNNFTLGRSDYQNKHEPCLYGWKEGKHYFVNRRNETTLVQDDSAVNIDAMKKDELKAFVRELLKPKAPESVIYEQIQYPCDLHPTMKPVRLIGRLMDNSSQPGDIVLDTFGGSGTTMIAAEQLGRKCYMIELDEHYASVIVDRWEKFTGKQAVKIN